MFFDKILVALRVLITLPIWLTLTFSYQSVRAEQDSVCEADNLVLGNINEGTMRLALKFARECLVSKPPPAILQIVSLGGNVGIGIAVHDILVANGSKEKLITEAYGDASSAASLIFLTGKVRRISCNSQILVHEASGSYAGRMGEKLLQENLNQTVEYNNAMANIYTKATGLPKEQLRGMMAQGAVLNAHEALRLGFATEIIGDCVK